MAYSEDEMLMLSGIQHFVFCPRQWALIHMEQQWAENGLTTEGSLLHTRVDNAQYRPMNNGVLTMRSVPIASKELGLYGITDAVELHSSDSEKDTIEHPHYKGRWMPYPIEYKRGHSKTTDCDIAQLVAQVICLEEQYGINIPEAALFYWKTKRREVIAVTDDLRDNVRFYAEEMHQTYQKGILPTIVKQPHCKSCSLKDICMPELSDCSSVNTYLKNNLYA